MHDLKFDLSRSLKDKVNGNIRKPTYDIVLMNSIKYIRLSAIFYEIVIQYMHDLGFDIDGQS